MQRLIAPWETAAGFFAIAANSLKASSLFYDERLFNGRIEYNRSLNVITSEGRYYPILSTYIRKGYIEFYVEYHNVSDSTLQADLQHAFGCVCSAVGLRMDSSGNAWTNVPEYPTLRAMKTTVVLSKGTVTPIGAETPTKESVTVYRFKHYIA